MTSFTLKHIKGDTTDIYTSNNISTASIEYVTPTTPMPLPQSKDEETILIKVEGNTTTVTIQWTVINDSSGNAFSGSNAQTAMEQVAHFKTDFVPVDVNDSYELTLGTGSEAIVLEGILLRMGFSVSGRAPVTWDGHFTFVHGNVQTQYDADKANKPTLSTPIANKSGTNGEVTLTGIQTDYLGSESAITHYVVAYRTAGTTAWSTVEHATTQSTAQNIDVDISATGSKDLKVAAKTTVGIGEYTAPVTVTVT